MVAGCKADAEGHAAQQGPDVRLQAVRLYSAERMTLLTTAEALLRQYDVHG